MRVKFTDKFTSFYFIGIGGVSMSGLAKYLRTLGKRVGGSDSVSNEYTAELSEMGIEISIASDSDNIESYDLIVYTDAIKDNLIPRTTITGCARQKISVKKLFRADSFCMKSAESSKR